MGSSSQQIASLQDQLIKAQKEMEYKDRTVFLMEKMIKSLNHKIQALETQNQTDTTNLNTEITQLWLQQSALTASYKELVENRTYEQLKVRLKLPTFSHRTLKPLFETEPSLCPIIANTCKELFIRKLIGPQKMLVNIYFRQNQNFAQQE